MPLRLNPNHLFSDATTSSLPTAGSQTLLFHRTMAIVCGMNVLTFIGTLVTEDWHPSGGVMLVLIIASFSLIFATSFWAERAAANDPSPLLGVAAFALIEGLILGPAIGMYKATLGPDAVQFAVAAVVAATAVFGGIGSVASFAYKKLEAVLLLGLFGMIAFLFGSTLVVVPEGIDLGMSVGGAVLVCLFIVVDFARLKDTGRRTAGWGAAGMLAMNIYLDMINLLLFLLRIMAKSKSK